LGGDLVEVFQSEHLRQSVGRLIGRPLGVEVVEGGDISRVSVSDEVKALILGRGASRFVHGDGSRQGIAFWGHMVSGDLMRMGVEEQESEVMLAGDPQVGFIAGGGGTDGSFMPKVELMAIVGCRLGVIEDGLKTDWDAEDLTDHFRCFAGGQGKGDVKGQDQAQDVRGTVNAGQIDGEAFGCGRRKLGGSEVIFPILIAQLELRQTHLLQESFIPFQGTFLLPVMGAAVVVAFVDSAIGATLPAVERPLAIGTVVTRFTLAVRAFELRQSRAYFAEQLSGTLAVVEVQVGGGSSTVQTMALLGQPGGLAVTDRRQSFAMFFLVISHKLLPIEFSWRSCWRRGLTQRRHGVDIEIAVVGVFLLEVVARRDLRFTLQKDLAELSDDLFQFLTRKIPTEPKNESCYLIGIHCGCAPEGERFSFCRVNLNPKARHSRIYFSSLPNSARFKPQPSNSVKLFLQSHQGEKGNKQLFRFSNELSAY